MDGQILHSTDNGQNWTTRGSLGGQPVDLAADAGNVVGVVNDSVIGSNDAGMTFVKRISGSGQH